MAGVSKGYHLRNAAGIHGPFTKVEMKGMASRGEIQPMDRILRSRNERGTRAENVVGLRPVDTIEKTGPVRKCPLSDSNRAAGRARIEKRIASAFRVVTLVVLGLCVGQVTSPAPKVIERVVTKDSPQHVQPATTIKHKNECERPYADVAVHRVG